MPSCKGASPAAVTFEMLPKYLVFHKSGKPSPTESQYNIAGALVTLPLILETTTE